LGNWGNWGIGELGKLGLMQKILDKKLIFLGIILKQFK
jgi:hypothetical protein